MVQCTVDRTGPQRLSLGANVRQKILSAEILLAWSESTICLLQA